MTRTVQIGPGRRVTLQELAAVCSGDGVLEWHQPTATAGASASATDSSSAPDATPVDSLADAFAAVSVSSSSTPKLSKQETIAVVTVTALHLAQTRTLAAVAARLVQTVKALQSNNLTVTLDASDCGAAVLQSIVSSTEEEAEELLLSATQTATTIARSCRLAVAGLAVATASTLSQAALPIACLSIDAAGLSAVPVVSEGQFDVGRPHRTMVTAAATCRAIWNASRFHATTANNNVNTAVTDLPQYHGPAAADIKASLTTLELEVNCVPKHNNTKAAVDVNTSTAAAAAAPCWDETVASLAARQAAAACSVLLVNSRARIMVLSSNSTTHAASVTTNADSTTNLPSIVQQLGEALQEEANMARGVIQEETAKAAEQARAKEAEKQARVTSDGGNAGGAATADGSKDEFAGMSDAQKTKILKKRAEKEAKAAAKRKAKDKKGVSLFGTGTQPLVQILESHNNGQETALLTADCIADMMALMETLLSGGVQRKPKIAKGTRDYLPEQMMIRQQAFDIIRRVFQSHGAVEIDTPVFELKDTLTGKYGEDSKLIYDLADQGGELLALRYDLTVPFARFLSLNSVGNIKRFHIGKVYRRDQPQLSKGRYREFYQCDFDIAGTYGRMIPDSECLCVACEILDSLPIGDFGIKLNHRRLLDAILDISGVPADKFRTICSAVDKLDKEPWAEVKREMVEDKGLQEAVADKIGEFVLNKGAPWEMYKQLMDGKKFGKHKGANDAMEDLRILFEYLEAMDKLKFISFDLSLARGLDYYTGVIYEAVCMSGNTQVGSIGGGGRYDNLVSMFQEAGKETPCVGVSVGIERVFTLMEARLREEQGGSIKQPNVNILVASAGDGMMLEKMKIARILWDGKLSAEFSQQDNAKLKNELRNALDREIPFMVIVGADEMAENKCSVKDLKAKTEDKVPVAELVSFLRKKGAIPVGCEFAAEMLKE